MVLNIFFVIVGLIVGFGLGFVIVKLCYDKVINGVKILVLSIFENVWKELEILKKEVLLEVKEEN